jgi:hypothetical protein
MKGECEQPGCKSEMEQGEFCEECGDWLCDQCLVATVCRDSITGRHVVDEDDLDDAGDETWDDEEDEFPGDDEEE